MVAFRNFAVHAYWNIRLERIWYIVENDLPILKGQIEALFKHMPPDDKSAGLQKDD
jgi:uncharacterized protein with HEPN domain